MKVERQLYRSRENRRIAGVCGGLAEYFNIDATVIRLAWLIFTFTFGMGLLAYIIAIIVIPEGNYNYSSYNPGQSYESEAGSQGSGNPGGSGSNFIMNSKANYILGGILILCGIFALMKHFVYWFDYALLWPVMLIIVGGLIVYYSIARRGLK
jgi:phage shock protein C